MVSKIKLNFFCFFGGKQSLSFSHPPTTQNSYHLHTQKLTKLIKKYTTWLIRQIWVCTRKETIRRQWRNTPVQHFKVNRQEQRVRETVFRNGGQIISYTMSNTESWAWANPPTKKLKASSLKLVLMPQSQDSLWLLPLKIWWFWDFWEYIFTFCRTCCENCWI